jgi:N-acetylneuraminate synthase
VTPRFIAEVSSNHNRDLDRSLSFVDAAAEVGCDAVKFQLFKVEELFAPEILERSDDVDRRKEWELPVEFLPKLAARCAERSIDFVCTPFYLDAVEELLPHVAGYKIASYELMWDELLTACARTGLPVIASTGMATMEEVVHAVDVLRQAGASSIELLHCVSKYPVAADECNLAAIETLRTATGCPVGWSDHSVDPAVIERAAHRWGASTIEFHFDLDERGEEFGAGHCWLPEPIAATIESVHRGISADGSGDKAPTDSEADEREWRADPSDGLRPLKHVRDG